MKTTVLQRIRLIMKQKDLNMLSFSKSIGFASTTVNNMFHRDTKPGYDLLMGIINIFEDINIEWLMTGKGEMLKTEQTNPPPNESQNDDYKDKWIECLQEVNEVRRELNEANAKIRELLEAELLLKNERKNVGGSAGLATAV